MKYGYIMEKVKNLIVIFNFYYIFFNLNKLIYLYIIRLNSTNKNIY
jgi:hypothetical protein